MPDNLGLVGMVARIESDQRHTGLRDPYNPTPARFRVRCMECDKRFMTARMLPECPACNSGDIEPD